MLGRTVLAGLSTYVLLGSYFLSPITGRVLHLAHVDQHCHLGTWEYKSSALEKAWMQEVDKWDADTPTSEYCNFKTQFDKQVEYWLEANARLMPTERTYLPEADNDVFSSFVTTYNCRDGTNDTYVSWIEPLSFGLRYPKALCGAGMPELLNRTYIVLASGNDHFPQHTSRPVYGHGNRAGRRSFLIDLGASLWSVGGGGPSQSFIIEAYATRGIRFDRILMWEATPHSRDDIFKEVPRKLHDSYQYMNIPVSADATDPGNPLNILKRIASPHDFVAVKLDIDTAHLENELVKQILQDPDVHSRIDEFFFEHHVKWQPMANIWPGGTIDSKQTLKSSYELFFALRKLGIRSHGWP